MARRSAAPAPPHTSTTASKCVLRFQMFGHTLAEPHVDHHSQLRAYTVCFARSAATPAMLCRSKPSGHTYDVHTLPTPLDHAYSHHTLRAPALHISCSAATLA
eukprot:73024-Chlamydomonas_euryale.AAC.3